MIASLPGQTCVLVVGAGPTGLLLAGELQRRGVPTLLIDARAEALHWDRATVIHPLSLEIFEALGLVDRFLEAGCRQRRILIHADGRRLGELDLAVCGSRYGFNLGLSEEVTEAILTDHLESAGGTVNRACRLVALQPSGDGVTATVSCGEREQFVQARWVVGCDGLRSTTRELSGIRFEGHAITRPWAVFDAAVEGWADSHELNAAYLDASPLILTALPEQRWRVYLRPAEEQGDLVAEATAVLQRYLPDARFSGVENPSRFHCHSRVASAFRAGPVFVAGDAAHVCSPAEGHGMNCGLHDAANLAWKLALVHHGASAPALLDSYEQERRPVAQQICRSGDATEQAHALQESDQRAARDRAIAAMLANPVARQQEVVAETEMNVSYAGSAISGGSGGHPLAAGQRLPTTIALPPGAGAALLHQLTHRRGHTLLLLADPQAPAEPLASLQAELEADRAAGTVPPALVEAVVSLELAEAPSLGLGPLTLLAVRPDGFIALRADSDHSSAVRRYAALVLDVDAPRA
ncbi:FAD-dependent monooxygenase [Synechococcus sp. Cruz-9H2]|uniref:FAD-dependent monooxygenase n=1 Tax=unclassified Synechococcus TaxID=2626047 RepID=UPI0020CF932F|nr:MULTISPECIES: FAD-dependent monooxygenase [unclassified Synechococcus]MCP9819421.1 FAD-dependent monooxygenase [Synechococcus sp. Cruz-9H2]MCP9843215.1 FAD-dependent monooxygenase [Synechococcus sp. Edmonson 11F2]MCP9854960.1 FAD-dependent monooxygenase [Synechococcus sp. Cruz-9C9]MCP9862569.1 FAD-dependent monooxygenase [Synechococcus sp. Cruz-7E5]MCP9870332.1 FAD-dependent monooxygenase [Synechococcus sp. Cruz-7B9]